MNDTEKFILKEIRELRKSVDSNFVIVHQKIDDKITSTDQKVAKLDDKVDGYKTGFLVFKAKFAVVGAIFVAIGNAIPYIVKYFKSS